MAVSRIIFVFWLPAGSLQQRWVHASGGSFISFGFFSRVRLTSVSVQPHLLPLLIWRRVCLVLLLGPARCTSLTLRVISSFLSLLLLLALSTQGGRSPARCTSLTEGSVSQSCYNNSINRLALTHAYPIYAVTHVPCLVSCVMFFLHSISFVEDMLFVSSIARFQIVWPFHR